jgi:hypothetical protein
MRRLSLRRRRGYEAYDYDLRTGLPMRAVAGATVVAIGLGGWLGTTSGRGSAEQSAAQAMLAEQIGAVQPELDDFEAELRTVMVRLDEARAHGRGDLGRERPPTAQAGTATTLAVAWRDAAAALDDLATGPQARIVRALRGGATAYGRLAAAAREQDRAAYAHAAGKVELAEDRLRDLLADGT